MSLRLRIFTLLLLVLPLSSGFGQRAKVIFVNNCPDIQLAALDIYVNDTLLVNNLHYHKATSPIELGTWPKTFVIRDSTSSKSTAIYATWQPALQSGKTYVAVINGVVNPDKFWNLDNIQLEFQVVPDVVLTSPDPEKVDLVFCNGAPQWIEPLDLNIRNRQNLIDDINFREFSPHYQLPAERMIFDLVHGFDENNYFGSYNADLTGMEGKAAVVVWSGSWGQPKHSPYALRMVAVFMDGTVKELPIFESAIAMVQFVLNSPDPALSEVDVWFNAKKIADNLKFREGTPMLYLNANKGGEFQITDRDATLPTNPIATLPAAFQENFSYVVFVSGVSDPGSYLPNPDGRETVLQVIQLDEARLQSDNELMTDIAFTNQAPDLPRIKFIEQNAAEIQGNMVYTGVSRYITFDPENMVIDIARESDPSEILATFFADMTSFAGRAGATFTSGFYNVEDNNSGPSLGLFCVFPNGEVVEFPRYIAPEANIQIVHNSPDPVLSPMDIYVDGELYLDDFDFRTATPFIKIPADAEITLKVAPGTSSGPGEAVFTAQRTFTNEENYVMFVQGVTDETGYQPNPNGKNYGMDLYIKSGIPVGGVEANKVALNFLPGAMDQKAIDLRTRKTGTVFQAGRYGEWGLTKMLQPASYLTDMNYSGDTTDIYETYLTNYTSFAGQFVTLFTSGFVTPAQNNNGPEFGLFGVFPDGRVFRFYEYVAPTAQMQFIHNAPDPNLLELDIYVNDELVADNMMFRNATEFLSVPADEQIAVAVTRYDAAGPNEAIVSWTGTYTDREAYLTMLYGVEDPSGFSTNPDGADIMFAVDTLSNAKTFASYLDEIEVNVFNGVTDLPAVSFIERDAAPLLENLAYGTHTGYSTWPLIDALYDVTDANDPSLVFGSYQIDLSSYGGKGGVLFLSGFSNPEANQGGAPLGLFMAFPDGNVIEFTHEEPKFAKLQIINNSADMRAEMVDIYINGEKVMDDLPYLGATNFMEVPAEEDIFIAVGKRDSESPTKPLYENLYNFAEGSMNFAMINGVVEPSAFLPNPSQIPIGMQIIHHPDVRTQAHRPSMADFIFVNGITDLPALSLMIKDGNPIFESVEYNQVTDYMSLDVETYLFDLVLADDPDSLIARFDGDIEDLKGIATLVFTSGFYDGEANDNSPYELTMQAAFPNGSVIPFDRINIDPNFVGFLPAIDGWDMSLAPNPAVSGTLVRYKLDKMTQVDFTVYDQLGRIRLEDNAGTNAPGSHVYPLNLAGMEPGTYMVVMSTQYGITTRKIAVIK